jgi:hypothetical protein
MSEAQSSAEDNSARPLSQRQLLDIAKEQNVNVPIMSYRVSGDRVELFLYGGQTIVAPAGFPQSATYLEDLSMKELRAIAASLEIFGRSKMKRDKLIEAILSAPS